MTENKRRANAKWRASHRAQYNAYHRQLRAKNPERYRQYQINYWKKKLSNTYKEEVNK